MHNAASDISLLVLQHQDLINRYKSCLTQLHQNFNEVDAFRREGVILRDCIQNLTHRLEIHAGAFIIHKYACYEHVSKSVSWEEFGGHHVLEKVRAAMTAEPLWEDDESQIQPSPIVPNWKRNPKESPTSVIEGDTDRANWNPEDGLQKEYVGGGNERDTDRVSLPTMPTSISVRSTTSFLKAAEMTQPSSTGPQKVYVGGGNNKDGPIELELYNQGMLKTELCNKWKEIGACPYGDNCRFTHGFGELRPVLRHPLYKTEVCRVVLAGDPCPYGHRCHFRHVLTEQEKLERDTGRVFLPKSMYVGPTTGFQKAAATTQPFAMGPQKMYMCGGNKKDGLIELEVYNKGMFKTQLCNRWQDTGACPYGYYCQFAHGIGELRPVLSHPPYNTEVCRMVLAGDPPLPL